MRELVPTLVVIAVILLAFLGMYLGYRGRRRRQVDLGRPASVPAELTPATHEQEVLYVSTTLRDQPLERVAVGGLGMRSRALLSVHREGVVLGLRGTDPVFIPVSAIDGVGRGTVTIDRVVERDGLVRIGWALDRTRTDTYLRAGTRDQTVAVVAALTALTAQAGRSDDRGAHDSLTSIDDRPEGEEPRGNS